LKVCGIERSSGKEINIGTLKQNDMKPY